MIELRCNLASLADRAMRVFDGMYELVRVPRLHADGLRHPLRLVGAEPQQEVRVVVARRLERAGVPPEVELEEQLADALHLVLRRGSGERWSGGRQHRCEYGEHRHSQDTALGTSWSNTSR